MESGVIKLGEWRLTTIKTVVKLIGDLVSLSPDLYVKCVGFWHFIKKKLNADGWFLTLKFIAPLKNLVMFISLHI